MAKTREQKQQTLQNLVEKVQQAKGAVFATFSGLTVKEADAIRRKCREGGVQYMVAKKTLIGRAFQEKGIPIDTQIFTGETAVAFGMEDETSAARILHGCAKELKEKFQLVGGVLEGLCIDQGSVLTLANIPGKQELLGRMLGALNSPITGFTQVCAGTVRSLLQVCTAIKDTKAS